MSDKIDFEPEVSELVSLLLKNGDVVFDIGANFGWHSIHFAQLVLPVGQVYCFEPVPDTNNELQENIKLNFSDNPHIVSEKFALGDREGETDIYVPKRLGSSFATLFPQSINKNFSDFLKYRVPLTTVDKYVEQRKISRLSFIKCDAEGAESAIISGAKKTLHDLSPMILAEVNNESSRDVFSCLKKWGTRFFILKIAG